MKLLNVVPGAGSTISATIAYSGTYSIGKAAISYYIKDVSLSESKKDAELAKMNIETDGKEVVNSEKETETKESEKEPEHETDKERTDETATETDKAIKSKSNKTKTFWNKFNINRRKK